MTEQQVELEGESTPQMSPGQSLRQAREASGLTQQALADKIFLKINVIQQLEADEVNPKTSTTFTKGYIRLYAKHVGVDPEPLLVEFDRIYNIDKPPQKLQSFSKRVSTEANDHRWMMVTYVILTIVIALVVIWWYQQPSGTDVSVNTEEASVNQTQTESTRVVEANDELLSSTSLSPPQTQSQPEITEEELASTELPVDAPELSLPLPANNEVSEVVDELIETTDSLSVSSDASVELVFTFADDCWVNIVDATGEAIAFGVKSKGRTMQIEGIPPFAVTLGAPQVVNVTYAGEPVDISTFEACQIARFELPMQE